MEGTCVDEAAVRRHGLTPTPKSAAFPSGEDSVWADLSSLLRAACNAKSKGKKKKGSALDASREFQIPASLVCSIPDMFCGGTNAGLIMYNYFKDAERIARDIKHQFSVDPDRLSELQKIEQVAEHNSVVLNVVCRLGSFDSSLKVS